MQRSSSSWCLARRKRGEGDNRRSASASRSTIEPQSFEYSEQANDSYATFLLRVNCPLCSETQPDKSTLIRHLESDCTKQKKKNKRLKSPVFKILPSNAFQCSICENVEFATIETYLCHQQNGNHRTMHPLLNCTTLSVYCAPCKMRVPNNQTQLELHMKTDFHLRKRKAALNRQQLRVEFSSTCIYSFFQGKKMFKCLECTPPVLIFTPLELISHFKTADHSQFDDFVEKETIHCSFCEVNIPLYEVGYHFISDGHLRKEEQVSEAEAYDTCPFCGFSSDSFSEFTAHVTLACSELKREKECSSKVLAPKPQETTKEEADGGEKKMHKVNRKNAVLVKDNVNIVSVMKILKKVGDIVYVGPYDEEYIVIEFNERPPIEQILFIKQFIKIEGKKMTLLFS